MLLIDGYNVLFQTLRGTLDGRRVAEQREILVERIGRHCAATRQRARIFFDPGRRGALAGFNQVRKRPPVEVIQLSEVSADDAIRAIVESGTDRTAYCIVSSDREVAGAAQRRNFETMPAEEFLAQVAQREAGVPAEKPEACGPGEADYWMRQFGLDSPPRPQGTKD